MTVDRTEGHTPAWPQYTPKPKIRTLAYMDGAGTVHTEDGREWTPESWEDMKILLAQEQLQVFCGKLAAALAPWWDCILSETQEEAKDRGYWTEVRYNALNQQIVSVALRVRQRGGPPDKWPAYCLTDAASWGNPYPDRGFLADLRAVLDRVGCGVHATPGSLGHHRMTAGWEGPRHHRPALTCVDALSRNAVGSRKEAYRPSEVFEDAWEFDRSSAYAAEARELPAGTACGPVQRAAAWLDEPQAPCYTWWARCYVRIDAPGLPPGMPGPFADRHPLTGDLSYPTAPGDYTAFLWKFEAEAIQELARQGYPISVRWASDLWYWTHATHQLAPWAAGMDVVRRQMKQERGRAAEALVKVAVVAGLGRLGMAYEHTQLVPEWDKREGDTPVYSEHLPDCCQWYERKTLADLGTPIHWHKYVLARQNFSIWRRLMELFELGIQPIAANVDAVYLDRYVAGIGLEPAAAAMGDYKAKSMGPYLAVPKAGYVLAVDKLSTPGMTPGERRKLMRIGEQRPTRDPRAEQRESFSRQTRARLAGLEQLRQHLLRGNGTSGWEERSQAPP